MVESHELLEFGAVEVHTHFLCLIVSLLDIGNQKLQSELEIRKAYTPRLIY